jgi:hypothetical protein
MERAATPPGGRIQREFFDEFLTPDTTLMSASALDREIPGHDSKREPNTHRSARP